MSNIESGNAQHCAAVDPDMKLNDGKYGGTENPPHYAGTPTGPAFGGEFVPPGDNRNPVTGANHGSHDDAFGA